MEADALRAALHQAVDQILDGYVTGGTLTPAPTPRPASDDGIVVLAAEDHGAFPYRWPDGNDEAFTRSRWYAIEDHGRKQRVLVAWTNRDAWGRMRERAVVFGEAGSSLYPWTEFVESDDGRFAAGVSDPAHPRALLKDGAPIPDRFDGATIVRTDQLFNGIRQGPSLRLVVEGSDEEAMVRHGYWVAGLRKRL
jgi:hypothetical protein